MNFLDLFSGIGGFRLGAEWAGLKFQNEYHSDIDEYANKVYKKHFPGSVQLGDITKVNFEELKDGNEWLIAGGFPCQDISIAGKGAGIEGSRSGLWSEMWRAIRILRPRYAVIENVSAITFRGLDRVIADLAEIGYSAEWQDIRAEDVHAPHKRERVWIVAYPGCEHGKREEKLREHEEQDRSGNASKSKRPVKCNREGIDERAEGNIPYPELHGRITREVRGGTQEAIRDKQEGENGTQHIEGASSISQTERDVAYTYNK